MAVVPSKGVRVTVTESLIRDLGRVSDWCELWRMKFNASKTMTMIVCRTRLMHPQSPPKTVTIGGTVQKESNDFDITRVTFDSKMTFECFFAWLPVQLLKDLVSCIEEVLASIP